MKSTVTELLAMLVLAGFSGCGKADVELTDTDRALAAKTGIPETFLLQIKKAGRNVRQLEGFDEEDGPTRADGVTIDVPQQKVPATVRQLQSSAPAGYLAFISDQNFGMGGKPDHVSVLKASSPYDILEVMGTNGGNYNISCSMVIARVKEWYERFGLVLRGAGMDWLEASFEQQPPNMLEFAKEVYEFCPDVVDQGTVTVEALADEMKRTNSVYLWWD
jgi:hypothetical protein